MGLSAKIVNYSWRYFVSLLVALVFAIIVLAPVAAKAAIPPRSTDDSWYAQVTVDTGYYPSIGCNLDQYGYCLRNCTSYVAQRLAAAGVIGNTIRGLGNAVDWKSRAAAKNVSASTSPRLGSVAYAPGTSANPYGHVAFVTSVNSNGSVDTKSYNGYTETPQFENNTHRYRTFINFSNVNGGTASSGSPSVGYGVLKGSTLSDGQTLKPGQYLASANVQFALVFQADGNLVLYRAKKALWSSRTAGTGADRLVMQSDGNLVLYDGNTPRWYTRTDGRGGDRLVMQSDGNLVLYAAAKPLWYTATNTSPNYSYKGTDRLSEGKTLSRGGYLRSADRRYAVLLRNDGNLVLYSAGYRILWHANTGGKSVDRLAMQSDGNLVLYAGSKPVWWTGTDGTSGYTTVVQNDGNFVLYGSSGALWHTRTAGKF